MVYKESEGRRRTRSSSRSGREISKTRGTRRDASRSPSPSNRQKICRKERADITDQTESRKSNESVPCSRGNHVASSSLSNAYVNSQGNNITAITKDNLNPIPISVQVPKKKRQIRRTGPEKCPLEINPSITASPVLNKRSTLAGASSLLSPTSSHGSIPTVNSSSDVTEVSNLKNQLRERDNEVQRLKALLGIGKEKSVQQDTIINQLTSLNSDQKRKLTKMEITNAALNAKLDSVQQSNSKRQIEILNSSTGKKKSCLSKIKLKDILGRFDDSFPDRLIPLALEARRFVDMVVFDLITESCQETNGRHVVHPRKRDWNGRCEILEEIPEHFIQGTPILYFGEDKDCVAVPSCPLTVANSGTHFTEIESNSLVKSSLRMAISNSTKFQQFSASDAWEELLSEVERDGFTQELYKRKLSSKLSNHKRKTRLSFFSILGFDKFTSSSDRIESKEQRKQIQRSLLPDLGDCDPTDTDSCIKIVDTSFWRTASWDELFNESADELDPEPEVNQIQTSGTDILFKSNAARQCFIEFTGYFPSEDDSVLTLARADSWFTTSILLAHLPEGKGGSQTCVYVDCFAKLLPLATKRILNSIRLVIQRIRTAEFEMNDEQAFDPSSATPNVPSATHFKLRCGDRIHTAVSFLPSKCCYYLSVLKQTFQAHVCHWLFFADSYVGYAGPHDLTFMAIDDFLPAPDSSMELVPLIPSGIRENAEFENPIVNSDLTGEKDEIEDYENSESEDPLQRSPIGESPIADLFGASSG